MKNRRLQTNVEIDGKLYQINKNGDYEVVLDVIEVLNDEELTEQERAYVALNIFYDFNLPQNLQEAVNKMLEFINCGEAERNNKPNQKPVMDWNKDFPMLIAPINRVVGYDIRSVEYMHWWTFVAAYMEIGECQFSNVVNIRIKKRKGKKLEKWEQEFYNENKAKIDLSVKFNLEEQEFFDNLLGANDIS